MPISDVNKLHVFMKKFNPIPWLDFKDPTKNLNWSDIARVYGIKDGE